MDPKLIKALLDALTADDSEAIKAAATALLAALAAPGAPIEASAEPPPADPAIDALNADPEPPPAKLAALNALREQTGCASLGEAVVLLTAWKAERDANAASVKILEDSSRFGLVSELVKLSVETPATAWVEVDGKKTLAKRLQAEPITELRSRVALLRASRGSAAPPEPPEANSGGDAAQIALLSADVLAQIKAKGMTPQQFVAAKNVSTVKRGN